jgi:hypothetical protein
MTRLQRGGAQPTERVVDVTVIVAVFNARPYLTRCLTSLVRQTIGLGRLQIIAIDDGSTDGSGRELDRLARRHPDAVTVLHQTNSGGPAAPSNRGLRLATGRYVFFVGADDYLGTEALERFVDAADRHGSDVVAGRMVGINGRYVPTAIFATSDDDVDLYTSMLPFSMSNTKLFRRSLLDEHAIRYPENLRFGSDQPFTMAACVHAKRISVLADYDYYFAVRRHDDGNITYRSTHLDRLACTKEIMTATARLLPPGPRRDALLYRSFASELSKLTRADLLTVDRGIQKAVCAGIGELADQHLSDTIAARLDVSRRVRIRLSQGRSLHTLLDVIGQNAGVDELPLVVHDGCLYAGYRGFREPEQDLPDEWFHVTNSPIAAIAHRLDTTNLAWTRQPDGPALVLTAHCAADPAMVAAADLRLTAGDIHMPVSVSALPEPSGCLVTAAVPLSDLKARLPSWGVQFDIRATAHRAPEVEGDVPLRMPPTLHRPHRLLIRRLRPYIVRPAAQADGNLVIDVVPVTMRRLARRARTMVYRRRH